MANGTVGKSCFTPELTEIIELRPKPKCSPIDFMIFSAMAVTAGLLIAGGVTHNPKLMFVAIAPGALGVGALAARVTTCMHATHGSSHAKRAREKEERNQHNKVQYQHTPAPSAYAQK